MHEHLPLTAALPAGRLQSDGPYDPARSYLVNGDSTISDFDSPMRAEPTDPTPPIITRWNTVSTAVDYYEMNGVPASKIVLGEPYYSLGFKVASGANGGLYQKITRQASAPSWTQIETSLLRDPAWTRHRSTTAQVPWLFDAGTRSLVDAMAGPFLRAAGFGSGTSSR